MSISFRRVSAGVLFGLILFIALTVASFAASAAAATAVVEVVPTPVNWVRPAAGSPYAGVQTITRSFAGNDPLFKPMTQKIGGALLSKAARAISNPWVWGAMTAADWAWDAAQDRWGKSQNNQCFKRADNDDPTIYCELDSFKARMAEIYTRFCQGICQIKSTSWTTEPHPSPGVFYLKLTWTYTSYGSNYEESMRFLFEPLPSETSFLYATDLDIFEAFSTAPNQQDSWQLATLTGNSIEPNLELFPESALDPAVRPDAPAVTQSDAEKIQWINSGLAQSLDANAPYYLPTAEIVRLNALQDSLNKYSDDLANQHLKAWEQPLTQRQYEESNEKSLAALASGLPAVNLFPNEEAFSSLVDVEKDLIEKEEELPTGPDFSSLWTLSTGSCNGFNLPVTVSGRSFVISANKQCEYYDIFNAGINFFLYLLTAFQVFTIYQRMMTRAV